MARRAVVEKTEFVSNVEGTPLVDPAGRPIRRVLWHWENIPEPSAEPEGLNLGYSDAEAQALYEMHRRHGALGALVQVTPKRYRLHFDYADGQSREVDATPAEAALNEAIGRTLHSEPLIHCRTTLIREA